MLNDFIDTALAHIDDLAELKVTLVALRLLAAKNGAMVSVTERELLVHPAVQSLSFADISLKLALQKAVARGTLLSAAPGDGEMRYFINTAQMREMVTTLHASSPNDNIGGRPYDAVRREIEKQELVEAYAFSVEDLVLLDEWTARGYDEAELIAAVQAALHEPRPSGTPPRPVRTSEGYLVTTPPCMPSAYYRVTVVHTEKPASYVVAFRELARRMPNGAEFKVLQTAVALFGQRNVEEGLTRLRGEGPYSIEGLIPLLSEQEESQMTFERGRAEVDLQVRDLMKLYELTIGLPPTEYIARDMKSLYDSDLKDMGTWKAVFDYAATQNKKDWRYIRTLLLNPSPNVFMPAPVNDTAKQAFDDYRRRVGRLDPMIANEINQAAQQVSEMARWLEAFDAAARANALNWNYIKKVLLSQSDKQADPKKQAGKDGDRKPKRTPAKPSGGSTYRRPQVEYTDEQRTAARDRARQLLAERKKKDSQ